MKMMQKRKNNKTYTETFIYMQTCKIFDAVFLIDFD